MKIQGSMAGFLLCILLIGNGSAIAQEKFEASIASRRQAITKGQAREFLAAMEAMGLENEKNHRWAEASAAFYEASIAAGQIGQFQKAIGHATKAADLGQKAKDPFLQANTSQSLANAYGSLRQFDKQKESLLKGIEVSKQITNVTAKTNVKARLYGALGQYYREQGELKSAIEHLSYSAQQLDAEVSFRRNRRARQTTVQSSENNLASTLNQLGHTYLSAGNSQEAIDAFERGITLVKNSKLNLNAESDLIRGLGSAYLAQKNYTRAMEQFTVALQIAENRRQPEYIENASRSIGDLLLQTQREAEAIPYYKKAIDAIESTRSQLGSEAFRTSFFENKGTTYSGMIQAQLRTNSIGEAFDHNERARSRAFLDILGSKVQMSKQAALVEEERRLHQRLIELKAQQGGQQQDGGVEDGPSQWKMELAAAEKAYAEFLAKVRKENKEQASLMNVEPLTLRQVQDLLDPGVTMLEYFVTNESVIAWVLAKDSVQSVQIPIGRKDLQVRVTAFRESVSQLEEPSKLNGQAEQLHKLLIQPALPHIKGKELIIVPHDVLHYLPFQALLSSQGKYLIEDYPINYLSSASLMQFTQEKRKAKGELSSVLAQAGKVLALGNPDLGDPAMSLRFAELEAREVQRLYPQSTVLLKTEATEDKAKGLSPQNDIVHFASHAELSEDDPLASAILLAKSEKEDGRLEVREIFGMDLKASLVVLSACETGLGKLSSGDELVGLTRAFIYAGTPSVMASLWKVEDSSTATLMASFYKNLKTMTKVEALRQAQLELIKGQAGSDLLVRRGIGGVGKLGETQQTKSEAPSSAPVSVSTSHPYFWAPFILVGEGK